MTAAVLVGRLVLASVFGLAGVAKLRDRAGTRQSLLDFGVSERLAGTGGAFLPIAELLVALLLVSPAPARWSAAAATALLVFFTGGIAIALRGGRRPDCHCFGQLRSGRIGVGTLLRNLLLAAIALLVAAEGRGNLGSEWSALGATRQLAALGALAAIAVVGSQLWLVRQLLLQNGRLAIRVEALEQGAQKVSVNVPRGRGLGVGAEAPAFSLRSLEGSVVTLDALLHRGRMLLLLFAHPGCGACETLLPQIVRWQREHADLATVIVISQGRTDENQRFAKRGISDLLLQEDDEVVRAYEVPGAPVALTVDTGARIASPLALGGEAILTLWHDQLANTSTPRPRPHPRTDIPAAAVRQTRPLPALTPGDDEGRRDKTDDALGRLAGLRVGGVRDRPAKSDSTGPSTANVLGGSASAFVAANTHGETLSLAQITCGRSAFVFFCDGAAASRGLAHEIGILGDRFASTVAFVVIVNDPSPELVHLCGERRRDVYHAAGKAIAPSFGATELPAAILIAPGGRVATELHTGAHAVADLLAYSLEIAENRQTPVTAPTALDEDCVSPSTTALSSTV